MAKRKDILSQLRRRAEERLRAGHADPLRIPLERMPMVVHELQVHQIELEMQNEELRRSQQDLEIARDNFFNLFEQAPVGYFILDHESRILQVNLTGANLLSLEKTRLLHKPFFQFIPMEQRDSCYHHLRRTFQMSEAETCELEMLRGSGSSFSAHLESLAQQGEAGRVNRCLTVVMDIIERKRAEEMNRKAKETAERVNSEKSRFLAAASHDLRQPLQALTTFNDVLARKVADNELLQLVRNQGECLQTMRDLLNALLDVSRLETGAITPVVKKFPVGELLHRITAKFLQTAQDKGLALRMIPSTANICSDPMLLNRILCNLVSNAIQYTQSGKILIGCRRRGSMLRIEVWDTRIGIPEEKRKLIFNEFYQIDNPARDRDKGLGLGLAIVKHTARLLKHRIELQSCAKGSVFSVAAPLTCISQQDN